MKAIDASFAGEIAKVQYGKEETRDAREWYDKGWNNALAYAHSPQQHEASLDMAAKCAQLEQVNADMFESGAEMKAALDSSQTDVKSALERARVAENRVTELEDHLASAKINIEALQLNLEQTNARLQRVYDERNAMAITIARLALAAGYKAGWGRDDKADERIEEHWRTVVYVQFDGVTYIDHKTPVMGGIPNFQLSWHIPPDWQTVAQANLPEFDGKWDGTFLGRAPADYVGNAPRTPHLSQITSVTIDADQMTAAQVEALHAEMTERSAKIVAETAARLGSTINRLFAPTLAPSESFATMQQFGNQESDEECKFCGKTGDDVCDAPPVGPCEKANQP